MLKCNLLASVDLQSASLGQMTSVYQHLSQATQKNQKNKQHPFPQTTMFWCVESFKEIMHKWF